VKRIEIDTSHFIGNYPDTCSIDASDDGREWREILPRTKLLADTRHVFYDALAPSGPATHVRLNVYPDGGVARMRVHAAATARGRAEQVTRRINTRIDDRELRACNGSSEWVRRMMAARPLADAFAAADEIWSQMDRDAILEAFAAHPRIGERKADKWASQEQSGTASASTSTLDRLADVNREYEKKFGYIYIVCATGKSADEMLAIAQARLSNDPDTELRTAAAEQAKITKLRMLKLVS
jgi:allantoicase